MQQPVEVTVAPEHRIGELVIVTRHRLLKIQRRDGRLRRALRQDLRVHGLKLADVAPDEDHLRLVSGAGQCHGTADAVPRAGDGDDAAGKLVRHGGVASRIERGIQAGSPESSIGGQAESPGSGAAGGRQRASHPAGVMVACGAARGKAAVRRRERSCASRAHTSSARQRGCSPAGRAAVLADSAARARWCCAHEGSHRVGPGAA